MWYLVGWLQIDEERRFALFNDEKAAKHWYNVVAGNGPYLSIQAVDPHDVVHRMAKLAEMFGA